MQFLVAVSVVATVTLDLAELKAGGDPYISCTPTTVGTNAGPITLSEVVPLAYDTAPNLRHVAIGLASSKLVAVYTVRAKGEPRSRAVHSPHGSPPFHNFFLFLLLFFLVGWWFSFWLCIFCPFNFQLFQLHC